MTSAIAEVIFLEVFMEKEKILEIVNEINKIARLNCMYNKIEEIGDNYDEFVEDFYFIEWLRMATDLGASLDEVINTSVLFDELLEELEMAILNAEDKLYNKCTSLLLYNKKDLGKIIRNIEDYSDNDIINVILNFAKNNFNEIEAEFFVLELRKLLQGGQGDDRTRV